MRLEFERPRNPSPLEWSVLLVLDLIGGTLNNFLRHMIAALTVVILLLSAVTSRVHAQDKPNIILINLDDADWSMFADHIMPRFPNIRRLASEGLTFTNMHVTTPFCGPSRVSLVRGQYAHRTGVRVNDPSDPLSMGFAGGYGEFVDRGYESNEIGYWMRNAGYQTMFVGKYHHHGFEGPEIPPGWDEFYAAFGSYYYNTLRLTTESNSNGSFSRIGEDVYRTNIEATDIRRLIIRHRNNPATQDKPFFLYYAAMAPHQPPQDRPIENMVDRRFDDFVPKLRMRLTPDYNEADVSDKPRHLRQRLLNSFQDNFFQNEFLLRVRSVKSVDLLLARLMSTLRQMDIDDNTYIILTSDNGYQLGHHRMANKQDPFNRTTNVPTFVWGPGVPAGQSANHLLAHIDICPTILQIAERSIPSYVDGKSFLPLIDNPLLFAPDQWREPIVIENWAEKLSIGEQIQAAYSGLRYYSSVYVEWAEGSNEFYDLETDPFQLNNSYSTLSGAEQVTLANDLQTARGVEMDPITTITAPQAGVSVRQRIVASGMAEDDSTVESVNLVLQSINTGRYFNGSEWQDDWARISAAVTARDRQLIYWNRTVRIAPETESNFDYVRMSTFATDAQKNMSNPVNWRVIPLDHALPTSAFTYPSSDVSLNVPPGPQTIAGVASDNYQLADVRLVIKNQTTQKYWTGSAWAGSWAYVLADVDEDGRWTYDFNAPADSDFWLSCRAVDEAGNLQSGFKSAVMNTH